MLLYLLATEMSHLVLLCFLHQESLHLHELAIAWYFAPLQTLDSTNELYLLPI